MEEHCVEIDFQCFICMGPLKNAHKCPHCHKLSCFLCVRRWLTWKKSECPHCKSPLKLYELVKCHWEEEVSQQLDSFRLAAAINRAKAEKELCELHKDKLRVFCWDCKTCICFQCALWGKSHSNHEFKPLDEVHDLCSAQIEKRSVLFRSKLDELASLVQEVEKTVERAKVVKDDRVLKVQHEAKRTISSLEEEFNRKLMPLMTEKKFLLQETERLENALKCFEEQFKSNSKLEPLNECPDLLRDMTESLSKPMASYMTDSVPTCTSSETNKTKRKTAAFNAADLPVAPSHKRVTRASTRNRVAPSAMI